MSETLPVSDTLMVERTLDAGVTITTSSTPPEVGPWQAMLRFEAYRTVEPNKKMGGTGVSLQFITQDAGDWVFIITPEQMPFVGTLQIG